MGEQGLLVGEQKVMAGIQLVGLGEAEGAADEVGERALAEPLAVQEPLAARRNQPVGRPARTESPPSACLCGSPAGARRRSGRGAALATASRRANRRPTGAVAEARGAR